MSPSAGVPGPDERPELWQPGGPPYGHGQAGGRYAAPRSQDQLSSEALAARRIVDVWADGLEAAFATIRELVLLYPYVAMDTEFPGVVARPVAMGRFASNSEFYYQTLKTNVNLLKIIQLGITFSDENGYHPTDSAWTWQFNFKFDLSVDVFAQDSIDMLAGSGIDFARFARDGIVVSDFSELLISSGLVLGGDPPITWISFHSGYDFGYLLKVLTEAELPEREEDFFDLLNTYFPGDVFDIKYLLKQTDRYTDMTGLSKLGDDLRLQRIGPSHQAGSDSLLTSHCFFRLARECFAGGMSEHKDVLYGLGKDGPACPSAAVAAAAIARDGPSSSPSPITPATADGLGGTPLSFGSQMMPPQQNDVAASSRFQPQRRGQRYTAPGSGATQHPLVQRGYVGYDPSYHYDPRHVDYDPGYHGAQDGVPL